jgi:acyl-CoA reductase-like NAD-dependent aldehyde dehydrogenase
MFDLQLLIGGQLISSKSNKTFSRANPLSGKTVTTAVAANAEDARSAVIAAEKAFPAWSATGPNHRREILLKAADLMTARRDEFVERMVAETGGTHRWARFNCHVAAEMFREAASLTTQIQGSVIPSDVPENMALGVRIPCGVVLGMAPWNAPIILGARAIATPLACGNTVILKASEQCPATHHLIAEVLHDAGLSNGEVNFITNAAEDAADVVNSLIEAPAVRRVNFTGSTSVGRIIAKKAAECLKPALLELGGKTPLLVLDDANIDDAVAAAAFGAFFHQGQICMSTERVIVDRKVADLFVEKLKIKVQTLKAGDPADQTNQLGTLINSESGRKQNALLDDAKQLGARIVTGGKADGVIMQPTVVDEVTNKMRVYTEESFGPLLAIIRVNSDAEAIRIANDTKYGLSAAVFSSDITRAIKVSQKIESGICHINAPTVHDEPHMPFGGVKASGYGRFGGQAGIAEFTELRWMSIQMGPRQYPI